MDQPTSNIFPDFSPKDSAGVRVAALKLCRQLFLSVLSRGVKLPHLFNIRFAKDLRFASWFPGSVRNDAMNAGIRDAVHLSKVTTTVFLGSKQCEQWEKIRQIIGPVPDVGRMTVNRPSTGSTAPVRDHKGKAAKMQGF